MMSKFWDMVDADTKAKAIDFIERIKADKIIRRVPRMYYLKDVKTNLLGGKANE